MYDFIKNFHSGWAYLVVLLSVLALVLSLIYLVTKKPLTPLVRKVITFSMVSMHIQMLFGIIALFMVAKTAFQSGFGEIMKNDATRLQIVEHPLMMFAAVIFMTIANARTKKADKISIPVVVLIGLAVLSILSRIPYQQWIG